MSLRIVVVLLAVVVVVQAGSLGRHGHCPTGINRGDHCLKPGFGQKNWQDAEANCVSLGGHLTSIPSGAEESYLVRNILPQNDIDFWLGGRQQTDGKWTWSDGSSFNYTAWAAGQPSSNGAASAGNNLCLSLEYESGEWAARDCGEKKYFLCNLPLADKNSTV